MDLGDRVIDGDAAQVYLYHWRFMHRQYQPYRQAYRHPFRLRQRRSNRHERTAYVKGSMVFTQDDLRITADNGSFNWKTKNAVFSGNVTVNGTPHAGDLTYNVRDKKIFITPA